MMPRAVPCIAATLLALACRAGAAVPATNDQLWTEADLTVPVAPGVSATLQGVVRNGEGLPNPSLEGGGGTLDVRWRGWTFSGGDVWVAARSAASGRTLDVNLPWVAIGYGWSWRGVSVSDRGRFERLDGVPSESWRYRNRLNVEHPVTGLGPISSVFASDEVFYDFARDALSRNRAQAGVNIPTSRRTVLQLYYMRQDDRFSHPGALNILGLAYRIDLR